MEGAKCCDKLGLSAVGGEVDGDVSSGSVARKGEEEDADAADEVFEHAFDGGDLGQEEGGRAC